MKEISTKSVHCYKKAFQLILQTRSELYTSIEHVVCTISSKQTVDKHAKLEGCIVLNEHNTVFARIGPLYAKLVFPWAHPRPERKRYLDRFRIFCRARKVTDR